MNHKLSFVALGALATIAIGLRVQAAVTPPPPGPMPPSNTPSGALTIAQLDNRIKQLERTVAGQQAVITDLNKRLGAEEAATTNLAGAFGSHTHKYVFRNVSMIQEKVNGRSLKLAIDPYSDQRETSKPSP